MDKPPIFPLEMDMVKQGSWVKALSFSKQFFFFHLRKKRWPEVFNQTQSYKTEENVTDTIRARTAEITEISRRRY